MCFLKNIYFLDPFFVFVKYTWKNFFEKPHKLNQNYFFYELLFGFNKQKDTR